MMAQGRVGAVACFPSVWETDLSRSDRFALRPAGAGAQRCGRCRRGAPEPSGGDKGDAGMRWRAGRGRQLPAREKPAVDGPARAPSFDASAALHRLSAVACLRRETACVALIMNFTRCVACDGSNTSAGKCLPRHVLQMQHVSGMLRLAGQRQHQPLRYRRRMPPHGRPWHRGMHACSKTSASYHAWPSDLISPPNFHVVCRRRIVGCAAFVAELQSLLAEWQNGRRGSARHRWVGVTARCIIAGIVSLKDQRMAQSSKDSCVYTKLNAQLPHVKVPSPSCSLRSTHPNRYLLN